MNAKEMILAGWGFVKNRATSRPFELGILLWAAVAQVHADEAAEWLARHNEYRALHGAAPLRWSETLAAGAKAYAKTCPTGHSKTTYGENLAMSSASLTPGRVMQLWYDEVSLFDYANPQFSPKTGHFTQIIWQGSQELGCGTATSCPGRMSHIWVCHYNPPGNVQGTFADNLRPASGALAGPGSISDVGAAPAPPTLKAEKRPAAIQKAPSFLDP